MSQSGTQPQNNSQPANLAKKGPMVERPLLVLDLETTGLNCGVHEITEIGALLVSQPDFQVVNTFSTKVLPTHLETATPEALQIGHFDPKVWEKEAIPLEQALKQLAEIGQGAILTGFNLTFDWAFLQAAFNQVGLEDPFYYHRFDVMSAAYVKLFGKPGLGKYSLSELCRFFGVTNKAAHTAFADAQATYEVFVGLMRYHDGDGPAVEKV